MSVMVSQGMTIQEKIQRIDKSRDQIERSSDIITMQLQNISNGDSEQEKIRIVKKEIRTIIKELNKMGGFCDKKVQRNIILLTEAGAIFSIYSTSMGLRHNRPMIEYWVSKAGGLLLDYNKSPFKLSAGLDFNIDKIKAFIKGEYVRE